MVNCSTACSTGVNWFFFSFELLAVRLVKLSKNWYPHDITFIHWRSTSFSVMSFIGLFAEMYKLYNFYMAFHKSLVTIHDKFYDFLMTFQRNFRPLFSIISVWYATGMRSCCGKLRKTYMILQWLFSSDTFLLLVRLFCGFCIAFVNV